MSIKFDNISVNKIVFETGNEDVSVNANVQKGNLNYDSELVISFSDLNLLINKIQKNVSENTDVSSLFESEKMYNGNLLYTLDLEKKITYPISLGVIEFNNNVRQIRA
jgi:hypothetical protein